MYSAKETLTGHAGLGKLMQTSLQRISQKAKRLKKYRFRNLYRLLDTIALKEAWKEINKKATAGVDKITAKEYAHNLAENIEEIVFNLKRKGYRVKLVRIVDIPRGSGRTRHLGIPAMSDKIIQSAVARILETIYEQDFLDCSYGYRPKVGQKAVIAEEKTKSLASQNLENMRIQTSNF